MTWVYTNAVENSLHYRYSLFEADDCIFVYTQQPPPSLSCNPYNNAYSPPKLQLTLACGAERKDDKMNQSKFDLQWFSNYSSEPLEYDYDVHTPSNTTILLSVTSPGQYWCQVLNYTDVSPGHLLGRSNVLEVLYFEQYPSMPMCTGIQSVTETKCADLSPSPATDNVPMPCTITGEDLHTHTIHISIYIDIYLYAVDETVLVMTAVQ